MDLTQFSTWEPLLSTLLYSVIGIVIFAISFWMMDKLTPFSFRKEIEEDQNISLGIIIGCVFIGLAIIIAAAIR
jgi:putative membrane protein